MPSEPALSDLSIAEAGKLLRSGDLSSTALTEHFLARIFLVLHDLDDDLGKLIDDVGLGFAEGHLIGDLEEVAECFGALAVETTDREAELVDGLDDRSDLVTIRLEVFIERLAARGKDPLESGRTRHR